MDLKIGYIFYLFFIFVAIAIILTVIYLVLSNFSHFKNIHYYKQIVFLVSFAIIITLLSRELV